MKKTAQKTQPQPLTLGTKRTCPKCSTKFYDFNKTQLNCPKCDTALSIDELSQMTRTPIELKKPAKTEKSDDPLLQSEELATDEAETFESVDDLQDEDEDIVEDLEVDEEEQE